MSYRVKANGYVMEADSLEEYRSILAILGIIDESQTQPRAPASDRFAGLSKEEKLQKFYDSVVNNPGQMLKALNALAPHPHGLTDRAVRETLRLQSNSALAGIMAGISKRAEKAGLTHQNIIIKEESGEEDSLYRYRLTETMREFMESREPVRRAYPPPIPSQTDAGDI
jgi:hypothetical protein